MKFYKNSKNKGNISIFASIVLAGIIFLNFILFDCSRILTAKANLKEKLLLAGKSVLASYESKLFNDYGIMGISDNLDIESEIDYFFNGYTGLFTNKELMNFFTGQLEGSDYSLKNNCGEINNFQKQITDIMTYQTPAILIEFFLEEYEIIDSGTKANTGQELYTNACSNLEEISNKTDELYRIANGFSGSDLLCINGFNNSVLREGYILDIQTHAYTVNTNSDSIEKIKASCLALKADYNTYYQLNKQALNMISDIQFLNNKLKDKIKILENWLYENKTDDEYYTKMQELLTEIKNSSFEYQYSFVIGKIQNNISILEKQIKSTEDLYRYISEENKSFSSAYIISCVDNKVYKNQYSEININKSSGNVDDSLAQHAPDTDAEPDTSSVTNDINSDISIDDNTFNLLPSNENLTMSLSSENKNILNNVLTDDYILSYFTAYTDSGSDRTSFFNAEIEYIISGKKSEKDNISDVMMQIYGLRLGLNLVHIVCDDAKREMAFAMGNSIAVATGGIGGPLYAAIIMGIWAAGESLIDIEDLKNGKDVPLVKKAEDWKLSIYGITNSLQQYENNNSKLKFDYKGYLRILLFTMPQETKLLRIMDLIELNLSKFYNSEFDLNTFYMGLSIKSNFLIPTNIKNIRIKEELYIEY